MFDTQKVYRTQPTHIEIMNTMILQRVEYLDSKLELCGSDVVTSWDPEQLARLMIGHGIVAMRFSTEVCVMIDLGTEVVTGRTTVARSGTYFINGSVVTQEKMRRSSTQFAQHMSQEGWSHAVLFYGGNASFDPDIDHIVTV